MTELEAILLTAGVTTIGTGLVTYVGHRLTVHRDTAEERERHGTYLAVRVAAILDAFVMGCIDVIGDSGIPDEQGEMQTSEKVPDLNLPDDVDWRSIDPDLMDCILTLPNEIASAHKGLQFTWFHVSTPPDHEELFRERRYQWGRLGILALDIATDLRKRYNLKPRDYSRYDPRVHLENAFREEDDMRSHGAEIAKRLIKNHEKKNATS